LGREFPGEDGGLTGDPEVLHDGELGEDLALHHLDEARVDLGPALDVRGQVDQDGRMVQEAAICPALLRSPARLTLQRDRVLNRLEK